MIAMVMCAGEGIRLRPLTYELPKPMMPVANKPVLQYTLENLKKHGITEVVINLHYKAEVIQNYFKSGASLGMKIHYSVEKQRMGTAGGVKLAEHFFLEEVLEKGMKKGAKKGAKEDDFLVTSGDGICDINFSDFIAFHKKRKSVATIALSQVQNRFDYGVPLLDASSRIKKFIEKPCWGDVFSDWANSGIYLFNKSILKQIPVGKPYDFGSQLFSKLLIQKSAIFGYKFNEFWTDIGNIKEYRHAQNAVLDKKIPMGMTSAKEIRPQIWVEPGAKISPEARLVAPCYIGANTTIKKNARIGGYAVLGKSCNVGANCSIKNSLLWEGSVVEGGANAPGGTKIEGSILGKKAIVPKSIPFLEGIVLRSSY